MKGRKPGVDNVVPLTEGNALRDFGVDAKRLANELRPEGMEIPVGMIWDRLAPPLCDPRRGRLNECNAFMFLQFCRTVARHEKLLIDIGDDGETYEVKTRNGMQQKARPQVAQLNETWRQVRSLAESFGMTPASERGLSVVGQKAFDLGDDDFT